MNTEYGVSRQTARRSIRAFTLVELLVVVAIIALLVSILLPTLGKAKEQTRMVVCVSNIRSLSLGFVFYIQEYNEWYPKGIGWGTGGRDGWDVTLLPYYENREMLGCPSDNLPRPWTDGWGWSWEIPDTDRFKRSYGANWYVVGTGTSVEGENYDPPYGGSSGYPPGSCHKTSDIPFPGETLLLGEMWECAYWGTRPFPGQYSTYQASLFTMNYWCEMLRLPTGDVHRNNDVANYLFCDGHAILLPANDPNLNEETNYYYLKREK